MQTLAVNSNTVQPSSTTTDRGMASLKSQDFFKILVTELQQQDPFEPAKTADMINEVSQIRSIDLSTRLTDTLSNISQQQHTAGASELIGKHVTANVKNNDGTQSEITGLVTAVRFASDGSVVLELDTGQTVLASDVTRITATDAAGTQAAATTTSQATQNAKSAQTAKQQTGGLFPWLSLDGAFHL
jgi:flagellar basal-body rod modification protein FlgD